MGGNHGAVSEKQNQYAGEHFHHGGAQKKP
jgi:hypothetical protein